MNDENPSPPPPGMSTPAPEQRAYEESGHTPQGLPSSEERLWAAAAHAAGIASSAIFPVGVALVIYLAKREQSAFVADQAREALNFQLTIVLLTLLSAATVFCLIGFVLLPIVGITSLVFALIAAIRAHDGLYYRYPFALRLI